MTTSVKSSRCAVYSKFKVLILSFGLFCDAVVSFLLLLYARAVTSIQRSAS